MAWLLEPALKFLIPPMSVTAPLLLRGWLPILPRTLLTRLLWILLTTRAMTLPPS
jgi:hypothetical protein